MQVDKKLHLAVGGLLGLAAIFHPGFGIVAAVLAGAVKEAWDGATGRGTVDPLDFVATVAGGVFVELLIWSI